MRYVGTIGKQAISKVGAMALAAVVAASLSVGALAAPARAEAASLEAASASNLVTTQASIAKTAVADAKAVIKKAKATSGTETEKLKKAYTYIAKDAKYKGVYSVTDLTYFKPKYGAKYYSYFPREVVQNSLFKKYYKKYAVDMFKDKKGTCFHYAALFGVTAKQMLGKSATVKLAAGASKHTGSKVDYHAWVEITMDKKTYIYDTQAGNSVSKSKKKATNFGKFCGTEKSKLKSNYYNYKNVQYTTVKL